MKRIENRWYTIVAKLEDFLFLDIYKVLQDYSNFQTNDMKTCMKDRLLNHQGNIRMTKFKNIIRIFKPEKHHQNSKNI